MNNVISEILQRRRIKRVDVDEKVRGMPIYAADLEFPGLLHGATVRSTRPHARVVSLDLSEALELEGVVAILTASDVQGRNRVPELLEDMPFLAEGVVRYVGEPIAIVVARDRATARRAVELGADDVDAVINISALKSGLYDLVLKDLKGIVGAAKEGGAVVKIIIETCYLSEAEIRRACELVLEAGADFVKTSTGLGPSGATPDAVRLIRSVVGDRAGVKASGGIRTFERALAMLEAGADLIGTSTPRAILSSAKAP